MWLASLSVLAFMVSPSTWVNTLGVLSENIYLCLSLAALLLYVKCPQAAPAWRWERLA